MKKSHIVIEILPRALWIIEGVFLFLAYYFRDKNIDISRNLFFIFPGVLIIVSGVWRLILSFIYLAKPMATKELMTKGPYQYVRHPMYVSMYCVLIGLGILHFSFWWFLVLAVFTPLWYIVCILEEWQMTDLWGNLYHEYKKKTGMFFRKT